jgi:dihydrofolate reductase
MGNVIADMSMSLDGFSTGPNDGPDNPLGEGGDRLHAWMAGLGDWGERPDLTGPHAEVFRASRGHVGAAVMGRRVFDNGVAPWGENPPFHVPVFVVTHQARQPLARQGGTTYTFVAGGIASALAQAQAAAGDKDVLLGGGADIVRQFLEAGLVDELQLHLVPVLLGGGVRLFDRMGPEHIELNCVRVVDAPGVTHLRFRIMR